MLQLVLSPDSGTPLVDQIVSGVRALIDDRIQRPGMRLPPIRRLAETHAVSRFTVVEAYDRLVALGYLESRRGSGFYVAERPAPVAVQPRADDVPAHAGVSPRQRRRNPHRARCPRARGCEPSPVKPPHPHTQTSPRTRG